MMPPGDTFLKLIHLPPSMHMVTSNFTAQLVSQIYSPIHQNLGWLTYAPCTRPVKIFLYIAVVVVNIYLDAPCEIPTSMTFGHRQWSQNFVFGLVAIGTPWGQKFIFTVSVQICLGCTVWPQSTFVTNQRCHINYHNMHCFTIVK